MLVGSARNALALPNREKPANLLMQSLLFHISIHEGCDQQPLEMTRIHFQSGSEGGSNMLTVSNLLGRAIVVLAALSTALNLVEPAFAGISTVPAPLVGAGLPGLAVLGGVYGAIWLTRKLRGHRRAD